MGRCLTTILSFFLSQAPLPRCCMDISRRIVNACLYVRDEGAKAAEANPDDGVDSNAWTISRAWSSNPVMSEDASCECQGRRKT